jgi:hypothetical protein
MFILFTLVQFSENIQPKYIFVQIFQILEVIFIVIPI